jgi:excisionase family DNA binding protein
VGAVHFQLQSSWAPIAKPSLNDLLKSEEVASLTGLSLETLAQWRSQRRGIPYLKVGRAVRYDPADVQAYLEGCRVSVSVPKERRQN